MKVFRSARNEEIYRAAEAAAAHQKAYVLEAYTVERPTRIPAVPGRYAKALLALPKPSTRIGEGEG